MTNMTTKEKYATRCIFYADTLGQANKVTLSQMQTSQTLINLYTGKSNSLYSLYIFAAECA